MDVDFPVHAACQLNEPTERIRQLVEEKENEADDDGDNPQDSVLGAKMLGDDNLPLHLACSPQDAHGNPLPLTPSTVSYLMEKYPDALSAMNEDGHAPLHVLLTRRPPLDLVRQALALSPPAVRLRSAGGAKQLPLHVAVGNNAPDDVIEELYLSYPTAVSKSADRGFLPLHFASYHGATSYTFKLLLATNHDALNKKDEYGGDTPLHLLFKAHGDDFGAKYEWLTGRSLSEGGLSLGDSVRLLLRYGAKWGNTDPNKVADKARKMVEKKNFEGKSVLEVAERCGDAWKIPEEILTILREVKEGNAEALDDDDAWAFGAPGGGVEGTGQQQQQLQANGDAPHVARAAAETEAAANDDTDEPIGGQPDEEGEEVPVAGHTATAANGGKSDVRPDDEKKAAAPASDAASDDAMSIDEPDDEEDAGPVGGIPDGEDDDHAPVAARDVATNGGKRGGGQGGGEVTGSASAADEDGTSTREPDGKDASPAPAAASASDRMRDGRPDVADDESPNGRPNGQEEEDAFMAHVAATATNGGERDGQPDDGKVSASAAKDDGTSSGRPDKGGAARRSNVSAATHGGVLKGLPPREDDTLTLAAWVKAEKKSGGDTKKKNGNYNEATRAAAAAERDGQLDASTDDEAAASVDMEGSGDAPGGANDEGEGEARSGARLGVEVKREAKKCGGSGNDLNDATLRGGEDNETGREEQSAAAADGSAGDGKVNKDPEQRANQVAGDAQAMGIAHGDEKNDIDEKVTEESTDGEAAVSCGGGRHETAPPNQGDSPDQGNSGGSYQQETDVHVKQKADVKIKQEAKGAESSARSGGRDDGGSVIRGAPTGGSTEQPQASGGNDSKQESTVRTGHTEGSPESGYEGGTQGASSKPADERHSGDKNPRDQNELADTSNGRAKKESPNAYNSGHGKHERSRNEERIEFEYEPNEKRAKSLPVRFTI